MNRRDFIYSSGLLLGSAALAMSGLSTLQHLADTLPASERMPVLFIGHGSPMNAITDNEYRRQWQALGKKIPTPKVILSVSAHWLTRGVKVTAMDKPKTIHDFGGFPKALFDAQYPAPGAPDIAKEAQALAPNYHIGLDTDWGLDHGTWSVLLPMFPEANIPVLQLSIDYSQDGPFHFELARLLSTLRDKGVLIMGSGNIVHSFDGMNFENKVPDWAIEFDNTATAYIDKGDYQPLVNFRKLGTAFRQAHPSHDHYLPLLYTLGAVAKDETPQYFNSSFDLGSFSMRSVAFGLK